MEKQTQHEIARETMFWSTQEGLVKLKLLSDNHLKNIKKHIIKRVNTCIGTQTWNGFSWEAWIYSIREEQNYRRELLDKIFNKLGKNGEELVTLAHSKEVS